MKQNSAVKRLHFFIGKGGVGKTTVSAAYASRAALREPKGRVLLISTDPAHSLSDILQMPLGDRPTRVKLPASGRLDAWQLNSEKLFADFLREYKDDILDLIDKGSIFSRLDIEPLLDTTLPGMAEISALLAIRDALTSAKYSRIVVDTAPFGHTLRLFSLPEQFVRFLNFLELAASRDQILAERFGGKPRSDPDGLVAHFRSMVQEIQDATTDKAELFLVTTAEEFSLNESLRCISALREQSPPLSISGVVLNRLLLARGCPDCNRSLRAAEKAHKFLDRHFSHIPIHKGQDPGGPILGIPMLAAFGEHVFDGKRLRYELQPEQALSPRFQKIAWPALNNRLMLVLGKGGVGKTTISAALAFHARHESKSAIEICSVDPAPSLDDIFGATIGPDSVPVFGDSSFCASELDAVALFRDWISDLRSSVEDLTTSEVSGIHLDLSFERQLLSELLEIVPPGVDEVLAIFRIFDLVGSNKARIVIDMAPTGHALELLRMPERILAWSRLLLKTLAAHRTLAFARDAAAKVAEMSVRVRELAALLKDPGATEINVVMLPELLPDRETERLIAEIKAQELPLRRIFVNRVLLDGTNACRRCARAQQWQQATLANMKRRHRGTELCIVRNFPNEIAGKDALESFTGELWGLA